MNKKVIFNIVLLAGYTGFVFWASFKFMERNFNKQLDNELEKMRAEFEEEKERFYQKNPEARPDKITELKEKIATELERKGAKVSSPAPRRPKTDEQTVTEEEEPEVLEPGPEEIYFISEEDWMRGESGYYSITLVFDRIDGILMTDTGDYIEDGTNLVGFTSEELKEMKDDAIYIKNDNFKTLYEIVFSGNGGLTLDDEEEPEDEDEDVR